MNSMCGERCIGVRTIGSDLEISNSAPILYSVPVEVSELHHVMVTFSQFFPCFIATAIIDVTASAWEARLGGAVCKLETSTPIRQFLLMFRLHIARVIQNHAN